VDDPLRDGVTFHDGTPLTAQVVKNNLDAYRGAYPARNPVPARLALEPIDDVVVVDPLTVRVDMRSPMVSFAAHLFFSGRSGIMAQAQLDDPDTCDRRPIGTGPFEFDEWVPNDHLTVVRNEAYWATDADGDRLPYLDEIVFRPIVDTSQLVNAVESGRADLAHFHELSDASTLHDLRDQGRIGLVESILLWRRFTSASMTALHTGQTLLVYSRNTSSRLTR
jgi:peptide/nickel transport system substrate-binding protein